ncbi:hypothetical protein EDD22DRAFT_776602, partial [Suillus occidentalis]
YKSSIEPRPEGVKHQNKSASAFSSLFASLYVCGNLNDAENVIVDDGTGYVQGL